MKSPSVISLAVVLLVVSTGLVMKPHSVSGHSVPAVQREIMSISLAKTAFVEEMRTVSGSLQSSKYGILRDAYERVFGRPMFDDKDEFLIKDGTGTVRVVMRHSGGKASEMDIFPSSLPSVLAENLRTGIETKFSGVDCRVVGP